MATDKSVLKIEKQKGSIRCKVVNFLLLESGEQCGTPHIFRTCIWENFRGTAFQKIGEYYDKSFELDGYTVHLALSIFCSLKLASSALLYVLLQLTQNLPSLYKDRNVLVDWQRGQFVNLGFNSDFFCNLSHVSNIVNPLMVFIFIFPYRYNL